MIICPTCGKENADEAWHCGYCGSKLRGKVTNTMFGMAIPQNEVERLRQMHAARGKGGIADAFKVRDEEAPGKPVESILSEEGWDLEGLGEPSLDAFDEGWDLGELDGVLSDATPEELGVAQDNSTHSAIFKTRSGKVEAVPKPEEGEPEPAQSATEPDEPLPPVAAEDAQPAPEAVEVVEAAETPEVSEVAEEPAAQAPVDDAPAPSPTTPEPKKTMLGFPAPEKGGAEAEQGEVAEAEPTAEAPDDKAGEGEPSVGASSELSEPATPDPKQTVMGLGPKVPARPPREAKSTTPAGQQADAGLSGGAEDAAEPPAKASETPTRTLTPSPDRPSSRRSGPAVAPARRRTQMEIPDPPPAADAAGGGSSDMTPVLIGVVVLLILATAIGVAIKVWG